MDSTASVGVTLLLSVIMVGLIESGASLTALLITGAAFIIMGVSALDLLRQEQDRRDQ